MTDATTGVSSDPGSGPGHLCTSVLGPLVAGLLLSPTSGLWLWTGPLSTLLRDTCPAFWSSEDGGRHRRRRKSETLWWHWFR